MAATLRKRMAIARTIAPTCMGRQNWGEDDENKRKRRRREKSEQDKDRDNEKHNIT